MVDALYSFYGGGGPLIYLLAAMSVIMGTLSGVMLCVALAVYVARKVWAAMQLRRGPNVVGPFGLLQTFADALKLFFKETIVPAGSNRGVFIIAPMMTFILAMVSWAVIPWEAGAAIADINVGILYIFAIGSLGVYGIIMSGWASNSKYAFLGGLRSAAQMVSYEVSIGFVLVALLVYVGSLNLSDIVLNQEGGIWNWHIFPFLPLFVIFFISALAETNRPPFDLPEAEAELVAGYQVEYSSMAFALFFLGEYANILLMCALMSVLFLGGWYAPLPVLDVIPGPLWLFLKIWLFFFLFAWVKATVPRYRYDQLMRLGWKVFLPLSLFFVVIYSGIAVATGQVG